MENIYIVNDEYSGVRLDVYLTDVLDEWTRSQIKKQIDNKGAFINQKQAKAGNVVKSGDEIEFICEGEDEVEALKAVVAAVESGLGE